ncbi:MAG: ornithine cyclodeaminase family protein, partial [Steroidobacteraceae bacterium]
MTTQSAAFLVIGAADVRRLMSMRECIDIVRRTMSCVSRGDAQLPLRIGAALPRNTGAIVAMPGYLDEPPSAGAKLLAVLPGNTQRGLSSHMGVVVLFDPEDGTPFALVEASSVTALRTAAATAVATAALARTNAVDLAILGAGEQAAAHLHAIPLVHSVRSIRIWSRSREKTEQLAARASDELGIQIQVCSSVEQAVTEASIICTTTSAREPILCGRWLQPGVHVNLVGASTATAREVDDDLVVNSRFFVDYRPSALAQA